MSEAEYLAIENTYKKLNNIVKKTPLLYSGFLSKLCNYDIYLKCENLQYTGSFKFRGAYNHINNNISNCKNGIVAASAGNHALGVAEAASRFNLNTHIFLPDNVNSTKLDLLSGYKDVTLHKGYSNHELVYQAKGYAKYHKLHFIPQYDDNDIINGQGTVCFETLIEMPNINTIISSIGGGGLMSGILRVTSGLSRKVNVIGIVSENAPAYIESLKNKKIIDVPTSCTINDGLAISKPGVINFEIISKYLDEIYSINDDQCRDAVIKLMRYENLLVEPAGAASLAFLLSNSGSAYIKSPVVVVLSGGNVDFELLRQWI